MSMGCKKATTVNVDEVLSELEVVRVRLEKLMVLDAIGSKALMEADASLRAKAVSRVGSKARRDEDWCVPIKEQLPLLFKPTPKGTRVAAGLVADIHGTVTRPDVARGMGSTHSLTVRLWSHDPAVAFRASMDAAAVHDHVKKNGKRVLLRYRLERGVLGSDDPSFHMQLGGTARSKHEWCWYPEKLDTPRFLHFPVAFITAVELVLFALYPETFKAVVREPEWRRASLRAQEHFMRPYFREVAGCFFEGLSLKSKPRHLLQHMLSIGNGAQ